MNKKIVTTLLLSTLIILLGAPGSFARPVYITNLTTVYGGGSCSTCHVIAPGSGMRDLSGSSNGTYEPRSNRTSGQRNLNRMNGTRNFNRTSGMTNSNRTFPLNSYGTLFESQPNHATDPGAALIAIGSPPTASDATPAAQAGTPAAPGFEIVSSVFGLFAIYLLARRHN